MSVPQKVRDEIRTRLWAEAARLDWPALTANDKARYYAVWTDAKDLGGRLAAYMDARQVRVYIKDTLLKPYAQEALAGETTPYRVLGIPEGVLASGTYIKPHGRLLQDGRQIAWSKATEWKATLMALHERSFSRGKPFGAVFFESRSRFGTEAERSVVEDAATKLGVHKVVWLD